jgi:cysteinyl-tRNA synthetase
MSKSLGNVLTIREALDTWGREPVLLLLLGAHWRKPLDLSEETLAQARAQADAFRNAFSGEGSGSGEWTDLEAAMEDDFNTAEALAMMHRWRAGGALALLRRALDVFGLGSLAERAEAPPEIVALAERRQAAREGRDYPGADRLRQELESQGWEVRDRPGGYELAPRA